MRRTPWNIFFHVLVGLDACILLSQDPSLVGRCGRIVDETARTLLLEEQGGRRIRVSKRGSVFAIRVGREWVVVEGELIVGRVDERLKRLEKGRGLVVRYVVRERRWYTWDKAPGEDLQRQEVPVARAGEGKGPDTQGRGGQGEDEEHCGR